MSLELKTAFDSNIGTDPREWIHFEKKWKSETGIVGIATFTHKGQTKKYKCVYKYSKTYSNVQTLRESIVYDTVDELDSIFFCKKIGLLDIWINRSTKNCFLYTKNKDIKVSVLFVEYIEGLSFHKSRNIISFSKSCYIMFNTIAYLMTLKCIEFRHNDMHCDNIHIEPCNPNLSFLYVLKEGDTIYYTLIPTGGYIPKLIDLGLSSIQQPVGSSLLDEIEFYTMGIMTLCYDELQDMRRLSYTFIESLTNLNTETYYIRLADVLGKFELYKNRYSC